MLVYDAFKYYGTKLMLYSSLYYFDIGLETNITYPYLSNSNINWSLDLIKNL